MTSPSYSDAIKTKNTDYLLAYNSGLMAIAVMQSVCDGNLWLRFPARVNQEASRRNNDHLNGHLKMIT